MWRYLQHGHVAIPLAHRTAITYVVPVEAEAGLSLSVRGLRRVVWGEPEWSAADDAKAELTV